MYEAYIYYLYDDGVNREEETVTRKFKILIDAMRFVNDFLKKKSENNPYIDAIYEDSINDKSLNTTDENPTYCHIEIGRTY